VDSVEVEEDDDVKEATLWCDPDSPFAVLHKAKEATTVHQCLSSQCPDRGEHLTAVCTTLHARCVRCNQRGHMEVTEIMGVEGTLVPACPDSKMNSLQDSIVAFERAADLGNLTQFRRSCPSMGYFPCRSVRQERLFALVSYDQMLRVDVETALSTIRGWGTDLVEKFNLPDSYDKSDENVLHALERSPMRCMTILGTWHPRSRLSSPPHRLRREGKRNEEDHEYGVPGINYAGYIKRSGILKDIERTPVRGGSEASGSLRRDGYSWRIRK
jgi:hypothetical protein